MGVGQSLWAKACWQPPHAPLGPWAWLGAPAPPTGKCHPPAKALHPPTPLLVCGASGCLLVQVVHEWCGPHHACHVGACHHWHMLATLGGHGAHKGTKPSHHTPTNFTTFGWWWCQAPMAVQVPPHGTQGHHGHGMALGSACAFCHGPMAPIGAPWALGTRCTLS